MKFILNDPQNFQINKIEKQEYSNIKVDRTYVKDFMNNWNQSEQKSSEIEHKFTNNSQDRSLLNDKNIENKFESNIESIQPEKMEYNTPKQKINYTNSESYAQNDYRPKIQQSQLIENYKPSILSSKEKNEPVIPSIQNQVATPKSVKSEMSSDLNDSLQAKQDKGTSSARTNVYIKPDFDWMEHIKGLDLLNLNCKIPYISVERDLIVCKKKFNNQRMEIKYKVSSSVPLVHRRIWGILTYYKKLVDEKYLNNLKYEQIEELTNYFINKQSQDSEKVDIHVSNK